MEDWLSDPLKVFDSTKGSFRYRKPNIGDVEADKWQSFHFATRMKLEGGVYFCRQLLGAASLPEDMGLPLLAHRQKKWYAEAFFFELCSAYDTLLQELNIIYGCGLDVEKVKWNAIKSKLPQPLAKIMEREQKTDWFKKVRWYRNTATHHYLVPTEEGTVGWGNRTWDAKVDEMKILCIDEQTKKVIREDIKVCENYLKHMLEHIHNVWSEMSQKFN